MNILICGKNSYVGNAFIEKMAGKFNISKLDTRTDEWQTFNFAPFDAVIFLAAIVHRPDIQDGLLYKQVNEDLPSMVAEVAAKQGMKHFVFFSSMAVYGLSPSLAGNGKVSADTPYNPTGFYGKSKLNAEIKLVQLQEKYGFVLSIVRPPNIYGENCPGNYYNHMKFCAKYLMVFPLLRHNQFSMIHVDNLSLEIEGIIYEKGNGVLFPQDTGTKSNASRIAQLAKHDNRVHVQSKFLGKLLYAFYGIVPLKQVPNLFGDIYYDDTLSKFMPLTEINYPSIIHY